MRIIVVGGGKVGTALCRSLVAEKHDVVLIEKKENVLKRVTKQHDIMGIVGNGANYKILEQAEVKNCDIFIAITDRDEVNMISAVLAKKMGAKETVVACVILSILILTSKIKTFLASLQLSTLNC